MSASCLNWCFFMCASRILKRLSPLACCITRSAAFCFSCKSVGNIKPGLPFLTFHVQLNRYCTFTESNLRAGNRRLSPQFGFVWTFFTEGTGENRLQLPYFSLSRPGGDGNHG